MHWQLSTNSSYSLWLLYLLLVQQSSTKNLLKFAR